MAPACLIKDEKVNELIDQIKTEYPERYSTEPQDKVQVDRSGKVSYDRLTQEQKIVVDHSVEFIKKKLNHQDTDGKKYLSIIGAAGTGKSTVARAILEKLIEYHIYPNVAVAAIARKAVRNIYDRLSDLPFISIENKSVFQLSGAEYGQSEEEFKVDTDKNKFNQYSLIFIDEASQISDEKLKEIENVATRPVIVFLGDSAQTRPIHKDDAASKGKSSIFSRSDMQIETLTQRIRQGENSPILEYADRLRPIALEQNNIPVSSVAQIPSKIDNNGAIITEASHTATPKIYEAFEHAIRTKNPMYCKIVTSTNKAVKQLNTAIQKMLYGKGIVSRNDGAAGKGDMVIFYKPAADLYSNKQIDNSEEGIVVSEEKGTPVEIYNNAKIENTVLTIKISDGSTINVKYINPSDTVSMRNYQLQLEYLRTIAKKNRSAWRQYYEFQNQFASLELGYAYTIHKAQGSTYDISFVALDRILTDGPQWSNTERAEILYTAVTRAKNMAVLMSDKYNDEPLTDSYVKTNEQIDKGSISKNTTNAPSENPKIDNNSSTENTISSDYTMYSGGAVGADSVWDKFAEKFGISKRVHFGTENTKSPKKNTIVSKEDFEEGRYKVAQAANRMYGYQYRTMKDELLIRDWSQVKYSDAVFAVGKIKFKGEPFNNKDSRVLVNDSVIGGTGYAVNMAILAGKPVYVFDEGTNSWFTYDKQTNTYKRLGYTPKLTKNFAGIGTREITERGERAIEKIFLHTFGRPDSSNQQSKTPTSVNPQTTVTDSSSNSIQSTSVTVDMSGKVSTDYTMYSGGAVGADSVWDSISTKTAKVDEIITAEIASQTKNGQLPSMSQMKEYYAQKDRERIERLKQNEFSGQTDVSEQIQVDLDSQKAAMSFKSTKQRMFRVNLMVQIFTDIVNDNTQGMNAEERKRYIVDDLMKGLDKSEILEELYDQFNPEYAISDYSKQEYAKVQHNWYMLLEDMASMLYWTEGVKISLINKVDIVENDAQSDETSEQNFAMDEGENNEYRNKDGWMIKAREVNIVETLSQEIRKLIGRTPQIRKAYKGEKANFKFSSEDAALMPEFSNEKYVYVSDDLGCNQTLNPEQSVVKLAELFSTITSCEEFEPTFVKYAQQFPWAVPILLEIRKDVQKSKENQNHISRLPQLMYSNFRKELINWWTEIVGKDGNTLFKRLNRNPSILSMMTEWQSNFDNGITLTKDSIYNSKGEIDFQNAAKLYEEFDNWKKIRRKLKYAESVQYTFSDESINFIHKLLNAVGIEFSNDEIRSTLSFSSENRTAIFDNLDIILKYTTRQDNVNKDTDLLTRFGSAYSAIAETFNQLQEGSTLYSFHEGGKMYQSFSAPSYIGRMMNSIHSSSETFKKWMQKEFKDFSQFYDKNTGKLKSVWLKWLDRGEINGKNVRELMQRKVVLTRNKKTFSKWTEKEYMQTLIQEYFSVPRSEDNPASAWYYIPLLADADSAEFIKFLAITSHTTRDGKKIDMKTEINKHLAQEVMNELERIAVVYERDTQRTTNPENAPSIIFNYDIERDDEGNIKKIGGAEFKFFPMLNEMPVNRIFNDMQNEGMFGNFGLEDDILLKDAVESLYKQGMTQQDVKRFVRRVTANVMEFEFLRFEQDLMNLYELKNVDGLPFKIGDNKNPDASDLEEFFYNNALAYTQIVRMTTTDLAFYKNLNDFQKRYKEIYAMSTRLYTKSKYGKSKMVNITLKDEERKANIYEAVGQILDNAGITGVKKSYIQSQYKKVNITDAQAVRTLESYRSVMDMMGQWTDEAQVAYENISSGKFDLNDFNILFNALKQFTFTHKAVPSGCRTEYMNLENETEYDEYGNLKVPVQLKNSEGILLAIYEKLSNTLTSSPRMRGLNKFMLDNGIDVANYESATKCGNQHPIDISAERVSEYAKEHRISEDKAIYEILEKECYDENGEFNPEVVDQFDYEDYGIVSPTTEHLLDHHDIISSQFKKLIMSDLPQDITVELDGKEYTKSELYNLYQSLLTDNILDSFREVQGTFANIEELEAELQKVMNRNARYTDEERKACMLVERNGKKVFNIPPFDPIQSSRIQQLMYSIIRSNVSEQKIRRGQCVQMSCVGYDEQLKIRHNDADGNLIFTEAEWNGTEKPALKSDRKLLASMKEKYKSFEEYAKEHTEHSTAYWEVWMPAYSKDIVESLYNKDENGVLDIDKLPDELRRIVGLRVPTEAKYSMQPIVVKGFLPQSMNSTIMLPMEVTTIVGSDFDIDKVFLFLPEFKIKEYDYEKMYHDGKRQFSKEFYDLDALYKDAKKSYNYYKLSTKEADREYDKFIDYFHYYKREFKDEYLLDADVNFKNWFKNWAKEHKQEYVLRNPKIEPIEYDYSIGSETQLREARNNAIIDIAFKVLTNKAVAVQTVTPGNFDKVSEVAAKMNILNSVNDNNIQDIVNALGITKPSFPNLFNSVMALSKNKAQDIRDRILSKRNPLSPFTQTFFHEQNATGGTNIGAYAIGNALHAINEWVDITLTSSFSLFGKSYDVFDRMLTDDGELVSDTLSQLLAASVDNVKDPVLAALKQKGIVVTATIAMARLGIPIEDIAVFFNAPVVSGISEEYKSDREFTSEDYMYATFIHNNKQLEESLSEEEKIAYNQILYDISQKFGKVTSIAKILRMIDTCCTGDNPDNANGPTVGRNLLRIMRLMNLKNYLESENALIYTDIFDFDKLLDRKYDISALEDAKITSVPFLQATTKCAVVGCRDLLEPYFPQLNDRIFDLLFNKDYGLRQYFDFVDIQDNYISDEEASKVIDAFVNELFLYVLNDTEYFGKDGMNEGKDANFYNYIRKFPAYFKGITDKIKNDQNYAHLKSNTFLSRLKPTEVNRKNPVEMIHFVNPNTLSQIAKERITKDWEALMYDNNPEIRKLAFQLFKYGSFFGLGYNGPESYMHLAPVSLRNAVPDYIEKLESLATNESYDLKPFVEQFVRNHSHRMDIFQNIYRLVDKKSIKSFDSATGTFTLNGPTPKFIQIVMGDRVERFRLTPTGYVYAPSLGTRRIKEYYYGEENPQSVFKDIQDEVNKRFAKSESSASPVSVMPDAFDQSIQFDNTVQTDVTNTSVQEYTDEELKGVSIVTDAEGNELCL